MDYTIQSLRRDLVAGFIVGVIAIPLAMSFAIASGVKPQYGIYTTIIAGFLISFFGGSKFQIGGPTGAFVPILLGIVMQYGYENLLIAGMLAGVILILMGIFKLGVLIQFIPKPVTIGFTSGIAVIIFSGQIANFLGLQHIKSHEYFWANMREIWSHLGTWNGYSMLTAGICLSVILFLPKIFPKIPSSLAGLIVSTVIASIFFNGKIATIHSTYGMIPSSLPMFSMPTFSLDTLMQLLPPAFVIAMLGGIESLLSAVVADGMTGSRHHSNRELIGQGIANVVTPLFGGIPATGAIARTATNIKCGAVSPLSGMVHGVVVLFVLLLFAPLASTIPLSSMAPILMVVAWNMSERKAFAHILRTKSSDSIILLITFLLTVLTNLTTAVEVGLALAIIMFVIRMRSIHTVTKVLPDPSMKNEKVKPYMVHDNHDCPQISIYTIEGPLFFGAAERFQSSIMDSLQSHPKVLLLRLGKVPFMDATGESNLSHIVHHMKQYDGTVLLTSMQSQPRAYLSKTGLDKVIGIDHFFDHTGESISSALGKLDANKCIGCKHFAFRECTALSAGSKPKEVVHSVNDVSWPG